MSFLSLANVLPIFLTYTHAHSIRFGQEFRPYWSVVGVNKRIVVLCMYSLMTWTPCTLIEIYKNVDESNACLFRAWRS